jgi:flagellar biosynthesis/type III secretory pathway protein FliH
MTIIKQRAITPDNPTSIPLEQRYAMEGSNQTAPPSSANSEPGKPVLSKEELKALYADEWQACEKALLEQLEAEHRQTVDATLEKEKVALKEAWQEDIAQLQSVIKGIEQFKEKKLTDMESVCVEVVFASVLKLIGQAVADKSLITDIVAATMAEASALHCLFVAISKADYQFIQQVVGEEVLELPDDIELKCDPSLSPGSCVVATQQGRLEARLDKQLEQFKQLLEDAYSQEGGE